MDKITPLRKELPRADKLRLLQILAQEEGVGWFDPETAYSIWTPYDAFDAADTLMQALEAEQEIKAIDILHSELT